MSALARPKIPGTAPNAGAVFSGFTNTEDCKMNTQCLNEAESKLADSRVTPQIITESSLKGLKNALIWPPASWDGKVNSEEGHIRITGKRGNIAGYAPLPDFAGYRNLNADNFYDHYGRDIGRELSFLYDMAGCEELHKTAYLFGGTVGTELTVDEINKIYAFSRKRHMFGALWGVLPPDDFAAIAKEVKHHDWRKPMIVGRCALYMSARLPRFDIADYGDSTPRVNSPGGCRGDLLPTDGWETTANKKVLNKGQLITIAGVYDIEPAGNRRQLDELNTFVVTKDVFTNVAGEADISIFPKINDGELTDNAAITVVGAGAAGENKGKSLRQGFFFHAAAMKFVNIRLTKDDIPSCAGYADDAETGLSLLHTGGSIIVRGDVKVDRPELALRIIIGDGVGG